MIPSAKHALNADVRAGGERIGNRDAIGPVVACERIVDVIAGRDAVVTGKAVVEFTDDDIAVQRGQAVGNEVIGEAGTVGNGPVGAGGVGDGIDAAGRYPVSGEGLFGASDNREGIVNAAGDGGEIAGALGERGNRGSDGVARCLPRLFPAGEEVRFVLPNGTADGAAELIEMERRPGAGEEVSGV